MDHPQFDNGHTASRLDPIEASLKEALAAGHIRNAVIVDFKFHISSSYWDERLGFLTKFAGIKHEDPRYLLARELEGLIPLSITHIGTWPKNLTKFAKKNDIETDPDMVAIRDVCQQFYERWNPIQKMVNDLKPMVVKGRAPSTKEGPIRDLTNTGTCACCDRNVKLHIGKIVDHGFDIQFGFRNGPCFGVGYKPIEASPEGAIAFRDSLEISLGREQKYHDAATRDEHDTYSVRMSSTKTKVLTRADAPWFEKERLSAIRESAAKIRNLQRHIEFFDKKIAAWEPRTLPDGQEPEPLDEGMRP